MQIHSTDSVIELKTADTCSHTIIWLHGLGADGNDFVPIVPELRLPDSVGIKFLFPNAPIMPVTINNGYEMRAWFDIYDLSFGSMIDEKGINRSINAVKTMINDDVAQGTPTNNIFLAGFSQGAVIALSTALTFPHSLGGALILSGFLPLPKIMLNKRSEQNRLLPIFMAHGTEDAVLPFTLGETTANVLQQYHYPVEFHAYAMQHGVCPEEIGDIREWLLRTMKQT